MVNFFTFGFNYVKTQINAKRYTRETRPVKYAGKEQLSIEDGADYIYELLQSDKPFMVARYGSTELSILKWRVAQIAKVSKAFSEGQMNNICTCSGFFPKEQEKVAQFADLMLEKSSQLDLLGAFYWRMEDYIVKNYAPQTKIARNRALEPWYVEKPWTRGLKGKKVLIIHPFEDTIKSQYKKRELLFPGTELLPEFELKTLKAVQTIAGEKDERFNDWFEALQYMYDEAMKIDFDVAIIGCGAYGFPLAAMLKESGKQAIHMGGATQYLFGIKSKRADQGNSVISGLYNDAWVRAAATERPKNADKVEGGCYW